MTDLGDINRRLESFGVVESILEATRTIARHPVEHFSMREATWLELQAKLGVERQCMHPMVGGVTLPTVYGVGIVVAPEVEPGQVEKHPGHAHSCWLCRVREVTRDG